MEFTGAYWVVPDFFRVFQVAPAQGPVFAPGEEAAAVVGHSFAERYFEAPAKALGRKIQIENRSDDVRVVLSTARSIAPRWPPSGRGLAGDLHRSDGRPAPE